MIDPIRDCPHGHMKGKCDSCELIVAEERIAELENEIESHTTSYAALGLVSQEVIADRNKRIKELEQVAEAVMSEVGIHGIRHFVEPIGEALRAAGYLGEGE